MHAKSLVDTDGIVIKDKAFPFARMHDVQHCQPSLYVW